MNRLLGNRLGAVAAALLGITLVSWWLGTDHGIRDREVVGALLLTIAFIKVRFVGRYFMELRDAPLGLRLGLDFWLLGAGGLVLGLFLLG
jgi:hypothetical protein